MRSAPRATLLNRARGHADIKSQKGQGNKDKNTDLTKGGPSPKIWRQYAANSPQPNRIFGRENQILSLTIIIIG